MRRPLDRQHSISKMSLHIFTLSKRVSNRDNKDETQDMLLTSVFGGNVMDPLNLP